MLDFAFIASFLKSQEGRSTLVMMFLVKQDEETRNMHVNYYLLMLVV